MAFYRCGGGGIPSSLKTDMNAVLNKKFGTSADYPPADWAPTVNLMGPLPEVTASGSIVTFSDGADEVPTKSWEVSLSPSLDGYSEVDVKHAKKNLLLPQNADLSSVTVNGITRSYLLSSQTFTMTGTNTKTDSAWLIFNGSDWIIDGLKKGETYTFYHNLGSSMYSQITYYDTNGALKALVNLAGSAGKNNTRTFTIPSNFDRVRNFQIGVYASATDINEDAVFMLCAGSSATTYEPYTAPTQYTADLGRTIYGGQVDIVNGEGESTHGLYTFTGNEVYTQQTNQVAVKVAFTVGSSYQTGLDTAMSAVEDFVAGGCGASNYLYVKTTMTAEDLKTYMANHTVLFAYVLATPETFTFIGQEINTRLGYNAFWSDEGDTEVTYRRDIDLALGGQ